MALIPVFLILVLVGSAWPSALPYFLAYFLAGGLLGAGFSWAARNHPDKTLTRWAPALAIWNLYAWPIALVAMVIFTKPKGTK